LPIKDGRAYGQDSRNRNENNKRSRSPPDAEADGENKRFKKQTGLQASALPESENDPEGPSSISTPALEVIAGHIAGHLRTIMLLTLNIISIEAPGEVLSDRQSVSAQTDDHLSRVASSDKDLEEITNISVETSDHGGESDEYHDLQDTQAMIPDLPEPITWDDVRNEENDYVPQVGRIYERLEKKRNKILSFARARDMLPGKHSDIIIELPEMAYAGSLIRAHGGRHQVCELLLH
jgi:hypothetical protein